jgi:cyanophycinase
MSRWIFLLALVLASACQTEVVNSSSSQPPEMKGNLFIIGGGKRPPALVQELIDLSGIDSTGYAFVLPFASGEPDSAAYYGKKQFVELGVGAARIQYGALPATPAFLDSLRSAQLIYITGGDQVKFMDLVKDTGIPEAIREAYQQGATIAGTSAGAAVMSRQMITGDEKKHPEYTGDFRTIEADNLILQEGLGLLPNSIIDQHFIYRMRMNRLMAVALEYPNQTCIGIDESTALIVTPNGSRVGGLGQIVVLRNPGNEVVKKEGLLGGKGLQLDVLLPGDSFDGD